MLLFCIFSYLCSLLRGIVSAGIRLLVREWVNALCLHSLSIWKCWSSREELPWAFCGRGAWSNSWMVCTLLIDLLFMIITVFRVGMDHSWFFMRFDYLQTIWQASNLLIYLEVVRFLTCKINAWAFSIFYNCLMFSSEEERVSCKFWSLDWHLIQLVNASITFLIKNLFQNFILTS